MATKRSSDTSAVTTHGSWLLDALFGPVYAHTSTNPARGSGRRARSTRRAHGHVCSWCRRAIDGDGRPIGPSLPPALADRGGVCRTCASVIVQRAMTSITRSSWSHDDARWLRAHGSRP